MARYRHLDNVLIDLLKSQVRYEIQTELYRGGIPLPTDYGEMQQRLRNIKISLKEEKLRKDTFHTRAPIPPRRAPYVLPSQWNSNYIPPNPTPTMARTYSGQGQPMDIGRTQTQKTCNHCGKLGYHISRECKGECQHCHQRHPRQWCNTQLPPCRPFTSCTLDMLDFSSITEEEKEQLKKAAGF